MHKKELFECPECGLHYADEDIAQKCAAWCGENKSCNLEIIKHSIESEQKAQP